MHEPQKENCMDPLNGFMKSFMSSVMKIFDNNWNKGKGSREEDLPLKENHLVLEFLGVDSLSLLDSCCNFFHFHIFTNFFLNCIEPRVSGC